MTCPDCEYNKTRAARWRAEAYKLIGHEVELPWVGLTEEDFFELAPVWFERETSLIDFVAMVEAKLKERNT